MRKDRISQSTQKPNKKYHHARLYEYDLVQSIGNHQNILLDGISCKNRSPR